MPCRYELDVGEDSAALCVSDDSASLDASSDAYALEVSEGAYSLAASEPSATWHVGEYVQMRTGGYPIYSGATSFTPSQSAQVIQTDGFALESNITIQPIPSNYGLVTWDGSSLTVS